MDYGRIDAQPALFETEVETFFANGGRGLNVTVPFKERAFALAREHLSARARQAGAVNTIWMHQSAIHGCNTDGVGLVRDLRRLSMLEPGTRILLLGAGGAARGVIGPLLLEAGTRILLANRTVSKAEALVTQWITEHPEHADRIAASSLDSHAISQTWDLIINATSSSLAGSTIELPAGAIGSKTCIYDMMYGADPTLFLQAGQRAGALRTADGLGMLVCQASESFRIWHGVEPMVERVIEEVRQQLQASVR